MAPPRTAVLPLSSARRALALAGALALVGGGCKHPSDEPADTAAGKPGDPEDRDDELAGSSETGEEPPPKPEIEPDDPRATALAIARAHQPSPIAGHGAKSLGFRLDKITHLFSLAATAKIPEWGAPGDSDAKLARDDDLDTAWRCEFGGTKPCVLGLALPERAKLEALRLYVAAGPRFRDYAGHPRVAKLRVHTEAGYVDAVLSDGATHVYVQFDAPIETQTIALEVLEIHAGRDDALVHLAEIEIYGTDGVPRQPIELDPDFAWLSWETTAWAVAGEDHQIRQVFLNFAEPQLAQAPLAAAPPRSRRLLRATAVFGRATDDYLLFERLQGTDCSEVRGSYVLFDKRNRMYYALGDLGGAGAQIYRHAGGRGFAAGWVSDGVFTAKGIVEEAGELVWKRPPAQAPASGEALLREWGFEPQPLARAQPISAPIPGCHVAAPGELDPLAVAAKFPEASAQDPNDWLVCAIGDDTIYATARCGAPARAYQLAGTKLIGQHVGKRDDARGLRLRRIGDRVMLELSSEAGDSSTLLWAEPGQLHVLGAQAGLFVRPPASCSECSDEWLDPSLALPEVPLIPVDALDGGEAWIDDGGERDGSEQDDDPSDPAEPDEPIAD